MIIPQRYNVSFNAVHFNFVEVKKQRAVISHTQAFLLTIGQCTRLAAAHTAKGGTQSRYQPPSIGHLQEYIDCLLR